MEPALTGPASPQAISPASAVLEQPAHAIAALPRTDIDDAPPPSSAALPTPPFAMSRPAATRSAPRSGFGQALRERLLASGAAIARRRLADLSRSFARMGRPPAGPAVKGPARPIGRNPSGRPVTAASGRPGKRPASSFSAAPAANPFALGLAPAAAPASRPSRPPRRIPARVLGIAALIILGEIAIGYVVPRLPRTIAPPDHYLLTLSGSDAIGERLAPSLVEAWLKARGATGVTVLPLGQGLFGHVVNEKVVFAHLAGRDVQVLVKTHGSDAAFRDLASGEADIGMASRRPNRAETRARPVEHLLAEDRIAVIVSPANRLPRLSAVLLKAIFNCDIHDWREVPGSTAPAGPIDIYARDLESDASRRFDDRVLAGAPSCATRRFEASADLAAAVAKDPAGIGFVGSPFVGPAKAVRVDLAARATRASGGPDNGGDSLSRRLALYAPANSANPSARDFLAFGLSPAGREILREAVTSTPASRLAAR